MALGELDKQKRDWGTSDFSDGLNSYVPETRISDNSLALAQNALIREDGVLRRRPGITRVGDIAGLGGGVGFPIIDILSAGMGSKKKIYLLFVDSSFRANILYYDGQLTNPDSWHGPSIVSGSFTSVTDGSLSFGRGEITGGFDDFVYIAISDFSTSPTLYRALVTAAGVSPGIPEVVTGSPTNCRALTTALGRLWANGSTEDVRYRTYYSDYLSATASHDDWDLAVNFIESLSRHGTGSYGIAPYRENMLFVGGENFCYLVAVGTGNDQLDWEPIILSSDIGCGSHRTIANVAEDLFFMDQFGNIRSVRALLEERGSGVRSIPLSIPIKNETDLINKSRLYFASAAFYDGNYWFSFRKTDDSFSLFTFNVATRRWTGPHVLRNSSGQQLMVQAMTVSQGNLANHVLTGYDSHLYLATDDGQSLSDSIQVYELDGSATTDDGTTRAIDLDCYTKAFDFGSPHQEEKIAEWAEVEFVRVSGTTGTFTIEARKDFGTWRKVATVDYTQGPDVGQFRFALTEMGRFRRIQFRFRCTDINTSPQILSLYIRIKGFEPKKRVA